MSIKRVVNHPVVVILLGAIVVIPFAVGFVVGLIVVPMVAGYLYTWPFIDKLRPDRKKGASVVRGLEKGEENLGIHVS